MSTSASGAFDSRDFLAGVGEGRTVATYQGGQIVYAQGDIADAVFYLQSGRIKIVVVSGQGKEVVAGILEADNFFGEGCLIGQELRIGTAVAMGECSITAIPKTSMVDALHREPELSHVFITHMLSRNIRIEADLIDHLFNSSERRLARALLLLANFGHENSPRPIAATITQETLAELIGTTRSRVNFFMNKFRRLGFINYNGTIEVHPSLLSVVLRETPDTKQDE